MIPRFLLVLPFDDGRFYYAGKGSSNVSVWVPGKNSATKFVSRAAAESFALLIAVEEPETISKIEVIEYENEPDLGPVARRKAGR